jgi:hypothetical protein
MTSKPLRTTSTDCTLNHAHACVQTAFSLPNYSHSRAVPVSVGFVCPISLRRQDGLTAPSQPYHRATTGARASHIMRTITCKLSHSLEVSFCGNEQLTGHCAITYAHSPACGERSSMWTVLLRLTTTHAADCAFSIARLLPGDSIITRVVIRHPPSTTCAQPGT